MPASSLLEHLNPEQRCAVTLPADQHALILAGAGSGKTRVLTTRIAWLLQSGQTTPGAILAVTFTNKAAREMLARLSVLLPLDMRGMWIGTFHGLCNRMLRAHHRLAGLPQAFQILDTQDQLSAVKRLCKQFNVDDKTVAPKLLLWFINHNKEDGMRPRDVVPDSRNTAQMLELYQLYEDQCQREGVVDFGELMLRSFELLRDHASVREHYRQRFAHVLVDEFQDTNRLQYAWLKQLTGDEAGGRVAARGSVIAVGDDDQSIYAFRGARVSNMADFVREFDVRHQIKLEYNYRSYSNILNAANALIAHNSQRLGKNLRTSRGAGEPVRVYEAESDQAEAQWMVDEIRQLVRQDAVARREIAVLYRSNAQSRVIESALFNASVPYRVHGGLRFFERAEIKHALAWLRLLENPCDDTSFLRVVNFPARGIGTRTLEALQDMARSSDCSLYAAVSNMHGKAKANLHSFVTLVETMRQQAQGQALRTVIGDVLEGSGLLAHYRNEREGADRLENLAELINAGESFAQQEGFGKDAPALPLTANADGDTNKNENEPKHGRALLQSPASQGLDTDVLQSETDVTVAAANDSSSLLAAFLTHAALEAGDNQAQAGQDAVQLMTVHASKGLEFDCVFIGGLEEGLFPHDNAWNNQAGNNSDGLQEERRLMYVAITRARQRLYLSSSRTRMLHGQTRYHSRSRFLDELPDETLKWLGPKSARTHIGGSHADASNTDVAGTGWMSASPSTNTHPVRVPALPRKQTSTQGLRPGMVVFHAKFGQGKVLLVRGEGDDASAQVHFSRHGTKWLALSVAQLTVVD